MTPTVTSNSSARPELTHFIGSPMKSQPRALSKRGLFPSTIATLKVSFGIKQQPLLVYFNYKFDFDRRGSWSFIIIGLQQRPDKRGSFDLEPCCGHHWPHRCPCHLDQLQQLHAHLQHHHHFNIEVANFSQSIVHHEIYSPTFQAINCLFFLA